MPLLERDMFLDELDQAFQDALRGEGQVVLVNGEAGIGKTTLVEWFTRERQDAVRVLWGACDALSTPRPLGPLHDMATQLQTDLTALLHSDANLTIIFSAVLSALQTSSAIIVFEDVHWADEATLDLLRYLGRRIGRTSALMVITYRDDELDSRHPLRSVVGDLTTLSATHRLPLPPLSEQAVQILVGERTIDIAALHHQTGGNPFFVTEVLASAENVLPLSIRDAILGRMSQLSLSAQAVAQAAAVIGARVEPWLLAEVTGSEVAATAECLDIGVLLAQGDILTFRHELARQIILESISPPHKMALHRMTLDALKASPTTRHDLPRLAHHAEAASDPEAVLAYAPAAAKQAVAASAHREAARLYALALRFADDLPAAQRAWLLEAYGQESHLIGEQALGIDAQRQAVELWGDLGERLQQGKTLAGLISKLIRAGQLGEAEGSSQRAIDMLEALPPGPELALAYRERANLHMAKHDCAEALHWAEKARALAEQFTDNELLASIYHTIGTAWMHLDYERGCQHMHQGLAFARDTGQQFWVVGMYANLGSVSSELYQFHQADHFLVNGIAHASEHDLDNLRLYMQAWQALTHVHLGRWREATAIANEVLYSPSGSVIGRLTVRVALGRLLARRGDPDVQTVLDEALELARPADNMLRFGLVYAVRAEAAWLAGNVQRTLEEARAVYDLAMDKQHPWLAGELAFWRHQAGDPVTPPDWLATPFALHLAGDWQAAAVEWERLGCPYEQARALADGDPDAQIAALAIFDQLGAQPAAAELRQRMLAAGQPRIPRGPRPATRDNPFGLTARQMDILALLAQGLTNAQIAEQLYLSPKTVGHHVSAVLAKLDVHSREAAATVARQHLL